MVIAIIAILSAMLMPALTSATDRSRVTQCHSNLMHIGMALKMYYNDQGHWPPSLQALNDAEFVTDRSILVCTKTGAQYFYDRPDADRRRNSLAGSGPYKGRQGLQPDTAKQPQKGDQRHRRR